jgi:hypothetical protein
MARYVTMLVYLSEPEVGVGLGRIIALYHHSPN